MRPSIILAAVAAFIFPSPKAISENVSSAAIIREINVARQNPALYATFLEELRSHYTGKLCRTAGQIPVRSCEGVAAVDEAVTFLRSAQPQPALLVSAGLCQAAADHCRDQAFGAIGHRGSDRSNPGDRINRYGKRTCAWAENISYGGHTARGVVIGFIIDDGVRGRGHRKNIFNSTYRFVGAAFGPHSRFGSVCSVDFVSDYTEPGLLSMTSQIGAASF